MYKLVRLIDHLQKVYISKHPGITDTRNHWHPEVEPVQRRLAKENGYTYHEVLTVSAGAIKNEYLLSDEKSVNHDLKYFYCIEPKGYQLLEHWWIYPYGMVNAILRDLGPTLTILFGLLGSGILLLLWKLAIYIINKI
jgi:hypothetical protein